MLVGSWLGAGKLWHHTVPGRSSWVQPAYEGHGCRLGFPSVLDTDPGPEKEYQAETKTTEGEGSIHCREHRNREQGKVSGLFP